MSLSDLTSGPHFQLGLNAGLGYERVNTGSIQAWVCLLMLLQQLDNRLEKEYKKEYKKKKVAFEKRETAYGAYCCYLLMQKMHQRKMQFSGLAVMCIEVLLQT